MALLHCGNGGAGPGGVNGRESNPNRTCHARCSAMCARRELASERRVGTGGGAPHERGDVIHDDRASAPRSNCEATHGSKAQPLSSQDDAQSNPNSSALGRWVKWEWWVKWEYWACTVRSGVSQGKGSWEYWRHHLDSLAGLDEADSVSILLRSAPSTTIARLHVLVQPRRDVQDAACKAQRHNTKGV
jgi:hypothetical protein